MMRACYAFLCALAGFSALHAQSAWFMGSTTEAPLTSVSSSAELVETKYAGAYLYPPAYILDGNGETTWCPGGRGIGESITIGFQKAVSFDEIQIVNGFAGKNNLYGKNNRVRQVRITQKAGAHFQNKSYTLKDNQEGWQSIRFDLPQTAQVISFTIEEVYPGFKYDDTCISDIRFLYRGTVVPYSGAKALIDYQVKMSKESLNRSADKDFRTLYQNTLLYAADGSAWLFSTDGQARTGLWDGSSFDVFSVAEYEIRGNRLIVTEQVSYVEATQSLMFQPLGTDSIVINGVPFKVERRYAD